MLLGASVRVLLRRVRCLGILYVVHSFVDVLPFRKMPRSPCRRNEGDNISWWMTGRKDSLHFYVLFRSSLHGQIKLQKMAGDLLDCLVLALWSNRCLAFMHRCTLHASGVVERERI